ncbi:MAG: hypothetical protein H0Z38_00380 [Firmicutes bacterium]|nr:hypothetical protein [Bacillota bacterium]
MQVFQDTGGLIAIYVGAVVGAGFATGQEINQFFVGFGRWGLAGVAVAGFLLVFLGRLILVFTYFHGLADYREGLKVLLGPVGSKVGDAMTSFFLFGGLAIMLAGGGEVIAHLGVAKALASLGFAGQVLAGISGGPQRFTQVNKLLVPFLIGMSVLLVAARWLSWWEVPVVAEGIRPPLFTMGLITPMLLPNWLVAAGLYAAFNLGIVFTVFSSLGEVILDRRTAEHGAVISGGLLSLLLVFFYLGILSVPGAKDQAIPMAYVAAQGPKIAHLAYLFLLMAAMYTSAVANGYALSQRYKAWFRGSVPLTAALFLSGAWLLARGGFVTLVSTIYPIYGYLWSVVLIILLLKRMFAGCIFIGCE